MSDLPAKDTEEAALLKQRLLRAHDLPPWPEYTAFSIETVLPVVSVGILLLAGMAIKTSFLEVTVLQAFLGTAIAVFLLDWGLNGLINISNLPKQARWRTEMGKDIPLGQLHRLIRENEQESRGCRCSKTVIPSAGMPVVTDHVSMVACLS